MCRNVRTDSFSGRIEKPIDLKIVDIEELNARVLIAAVLTLVVSWTGTFLHDIDELELFSFLTEITVALHTHDDDVKEHVHANFAAHHHHDDDGTTAFHAPEPHEHDPSALGRISQDTLPILCLAGPPRLLWYSLTIGKEQSESYASQERPPPFRKLPTYLLYHALLI